MPCPKPDPTTTIVGHVTIIPTPPNKGRTRGQCQLAPGQTMPEGLPKPTAAQLSDFWPETYAIVQVDKYSLTGQADDCTFGIKFKKCTYSAERRYFLQGIQLGKTETVPGELELLDGPIGVCWGDLFQLVAQIFGFVQPYLPKLLGMGSKGVSKSEEFALARKLDAVLKVPRTRRKAAASRKTRAR